MPRVVTDRDEHQLPHVPLTPTRQKQEGQCPRKCRVPTRSRSRRSCAASISTSYVASLPPFSSARVGGALATGAACMALAVHAEGSAPSRARPCSGSVEMIRWYWKSYPVDEKSRRLLLKRDDGNTLTLVASPSVRNIGQIRGGDSSLLSMVGHRPIRSSEFRGERCKATRARHLRRHPRREETATARNAKVVHSIVADIIAIDDKSGIRHASRDRRTM